MQRLITELWHDVEATVFIVSHALSEAVYLGDRVWIMTHAPGRIGREFTDIIPPLRDADPMEVQETSAFKEVVAEVGRAFKEVELEAESVDDDPALAEPSDEADGA
jgi:NitT/TauT family transport system ATP-binding protein